MIYDIIISILPIIIPYIILGENLANVLLGISGIIYILFNSKYSNRLNKMFIYCTLGLIVTALLSVCIIDNSVYAISGMSVYFNIFIYYIVFRIIVNKKNNINLIIEYIIKLSAIICCFSIIYEGIILDKRLVGNIGYANTYGLILLIMLFLSETIEFKYRDITKKVFILGIFLTSSRTTLAILILYTIYNFIISKFKDKNFILNIVEVILYYLIIENFNVATIFILPILIPIVSWLFNNIKVKSNKLVYGIILLVIILFLIIPNNSVKRILNIFLENGSLQERLISFEDAISAIRENALGLGINNYEFSHYKYATAFYDIKYLHNSILQVAYDIGVIGSIFYILIFILSNYLLIKSNIKYKNNYLFIVNAILLHSMMDFDNVFSITTIMISFCVSIIDYNKGLINLNTKLRFILILPMIVFIYCGIYEASIKSGIGLEATEKLPIKDYRVYLSLSDKEIEKYNEYKNIESLNKSKLNLEKAKKYSRENVTIIWNLAYVYEKLGDYSSAIINRDKVLELQGLYFDAYKEYFRMLNELYKKTDDKYYKHKISELEYKYYKNIDKLNFKSKYLKNQLQTKI